MSQNILVSPRQTTAHRGPKRKTGFKNAAKLLAYLEIQTVPTYISPRHEALAQAVLVIKIAGWVRDIMCYKSDSIFILSPRGLVISGNRAELR